MIQQRVDGERSISREALRSAKELFHQHLRRARLKPNQQRDAILRCFLEARERLSPEELHQRVRARDPGIGFTTVYRTLKLLTTCGLASKVAFAGGIARYEHPYNRRSRHHIVCTQCGAWVEFFAPELARLEKEIGRRYRYRATRHSLQIYGLCEGCRRQHTRRAA